MFFVFTLCFFNLCGRNDIYFDINIQSCIYISLIKGFKIQERREKKNESPVVHFYDLTVTVPHECFQSNNFENFFQVFLKSSSCSFSLYMKYSYSYTDLIFIFKCAKFNDRSIQAQDNIYDFVINIMTLIGRKRSVFNKYPRIISFAAKFKLISVTSFNQCFKSFHNFL